jgi:LPS-assembly lipoprotein
MIAFIGTRLHFGLFLLAVGLGTLMAGCGFQLRGSYSLPYESIYVGGADYNLIVANMKRAIRNTGTRLTESKEDAQATFLPAGEKRESKILSLSSSGRVREKRLVYQYNYRIVDNKGRDLVLPGTVELSRDITYADSDVLAKTQEEALLWRDMEGDLVQQLMRRLAAAKPTAPATPE